MLDEVCVLNRLKADIDAHAQRFSTNALKQAISNLYDRTSSGVGADVTAGEARYLFLETYIPIGELIAMRTGEEGVAVTVQVE